jgi:homoserine O-acetyltransferase/O-succinyltransferase
MTSRALLAVVTLFLAACTVAPQPGDNGSAMVAPDSMESVVKRTFTTYGFRLQSGKTLPEMTLAFETYGRLAPDGRNAILVTHGGTGGQHMAGKYSPTDRAPGGWDTLIGPGKAIDTNKYFVVSSNVLGSSYGSTAPASINPATGKRYGPDFPEISMHDIVTAQRTLLRGLGVHRLVAVVGPSYGGYQAFQWSVSYPDDMAGIAAVITAPRGSGKESDVQELVDRFAKDPNWNGGWHYDRGGIPDTLTTLRIETLTRYGWNEILAEKFPTQAERDAEIRRRAEPWAKEFDPNSMVTMRRAAVRYNAEKDFSKIRAKVLYVISRSDKLFPPSIAPDVMDKLAKAGVDAKYFEIDTDFGHSATGVEWAKWGPTLKAFVEGLSK